MKKERIRVWMLCFFGLMVAAYLEFCTIIAFLYVGFNGYGGIWMEHTLKSEIIFCIVLYVPVLLLFFILALRMIIHHRRKAAIKYYFCDILFCISAIVMSFLIFYFFKEPRQTIIDIIMYTISESGWLYYPVP